MTDVDDVEDECAEAGQVVLPLLRVLLQQYREQQLQWLRDAEEVDDPEAFQEVEGEVLAAIDVQQAWYGGHDIEDEVGLDVVVADR